MNCDQALQLRIDRKINSDQLAILLYLNSRGWGTSSQSQLAAVFGVSHDRIQRAVVKLRKMGLEPLPCVDDRVSDRVSDRVKATAKIDNDINEFPFMASSDRVSDRVSDRTNNRDNPSPPSPPPSPSFPPDPPNNYIPRLSPLSFRSKLKLPTGTETCRGRDLGFRAGANELEKQKRTGANGKSERLVVHGDNLWDWGKRALGNLGELSPQAASRVIGLWLKTHDETEVINALRRAMEAQPADPVPWITAALGRRSRPDPRMAGRAMI